MNTRSVFKGLVWKTVEYAATLPELFRARIRTAAYRRTACFATTAKVVGGGVILNPSRERGAITIGDHTILRGELFVFPHAGQIQIGKWCFIGEHSHVWSSCSIEIGDRVLISHGVNIHDTNGHPVSPKDRHDQFREIAQRGHPADITTIEARPIVIGDDVWIGFGATVLKGVNVGARSIVAAAAVVVDDVPPDVIVAGNPARVVRKIGDAPAARAAAPLKRN